MTEDFSHAQLLLTDSAQLGTLNQVGRLIVMTCLLERASTSYFLFQEDTAWPGGAVIRAALAQCWLSLELGLPDRPLLVSAEQCEDAMPDSEDFSSPYVSAAIDAATIAACCMEFLAAPKDGLIEQAFRARFDTVDLFLQATSDLDLLGSDYEQAFLSHAIVMEEVEFIRGDMQLAASASEGPDLLARTVAHVRKGGYGTLRLAFPEDEL